MIFRDRDQAAAMLAERLGDYQGQGALVLAIPRGAVPMAKIVAQALAGDYDVVLVRKLGAPANPEFAIGAVEESGWVYLSPWAEAAGADAQYVERARERELETIRRRRAQYSPLRPARDPKNRIVIVLDDGLATGSTMIAALHALRAQAPKKLVCAVPVAPPDTLKKVAAYCDETVCLYATEDFRAVGQFYADFRQIEDEEVIEILRERPSTGGGVRA